MSVAANDRVQIRCLLRNGEVHASPELLLHFLELGSKPRLHRLPDHREPSPPRLPADVREAEKVEGLRLPLASLLPRLSSEAPKLDEPGFLGVQLQTEFREPLAKLTLELLGFVSILKAHHEVVSKANDNHIAPRSPPPPLLDPQIKHVVQIDVGQQRANAPALHRAFRTDDSLPVFQHARVQPFHLSLFDPDRQRVQCLMLAALRPEPILESEKVRFVDGT